MLISCISWQTPTIATLWLRFNWLLINHISLPACQENPCMWLINRWCNTKYLHTCFPPPPTPTTTTKLLTGLLQILFLAGATQHPIQQHCVQSHEVYNLQLPPCAYCESYKELLHIMWIVFDDTDSLLACGTQPNHIIPLLPTSKEGTRFLHILVLLIRVTN